MQVDIFNTTNKYKIIYADPPWSFKTYSDAGKDRSPDNHYKVMNLEDIKNLPVKQLADKDCVLFMWTIDTHVPQALEVMKSWGFTYKTVGFTWTKINKSAKLNSIDASKDVFTGMGYWTRCLHPDTKIYLLNKETEEVLSVSISFLNTTNYLLYKIWTNNGWKEIKNVIRNKIQNKVKFLTSFNNFICSDNHLLVYKYTDHKGHHTEIGKYSNLLIRKNKYTKASVNLLFSQKGVESTNPISKINKLNLEDELGFLLGLYCAEGSYLKDNGIQFSLNANELYMHERLDKYISSLNIPKDRYYNSNIKPKAYTYNNNLYIHLYSSIIRDIVEKFIIGRTAQTKRLNLELLYQTPLSFRKAFIQGMLDGDGCKNMGKYQRLVLCNKDLINDFKQLCLFCGILCKIDSPQLKEDLRPGWDHRLYEKHILRYINPRNKDIVFKDNIVLPIEIVFNEIESSNEEFIDLEVEDHIFIANDLITHNSNSEMCLLGEGPEFDVDRCFMGTIGKPKRESMSVRRAVLDYRREHSRKPDQIYDRIEQLMGDIPRIELFARNERSGWHSWGNEVTKYNEEIK